MTLLTNIMLCSLPPIDKKDFPNINSDTKQREGVDKLR